MPNAAGFVCMFFPRFPTLMQMECAVDVVALSSCVMCHQSLPLCNNVGLIIQWQFQYKIGFISYCAHIALSEQLKKNYKRWSDGQ